MKENGLSIKEFCSICGIGRSTYENILKGNGNINAFAYCKVAKILKIKLSELVSDEVAKH